MWFCTVYYYAYVIRITRNSLITGRQFSHLYRWVYSGNLAINDAYISFKICVSHMVNFDVITWQIICAVRSWPTILVIVDSITGRWNWWRKIVKKLQQELFYIMIRNRIIRVILSWQLCLLNVVCPSHENLDLL